MNIVFKEFRLCKERMQGFTVAELVVVVFLVVLLLGAALSMLRFGILSQRSVTESQEVLGQASFAVDYMARQLRYASKGSSSCTAGAAHYELTGNGVKFRNAQEECVHLYLETASGVLQEQKNSGSPQALTSGDVEIAAFQLQLVGELPGDGAQPRLTLSLLAQSRSGPEYIVLQKSVSQRLLDN